GDTARWAALAWLGANTGEVGLERRGESAELEGLVPDARGTPVGAARVSLFCQNASSGRELRRWPNVILAVDTDGSFRLGGMHPGRAEVRVVAPGFAMKRERAVLEERATTRITVVLDEGFTVRGSVHLPDGAPLVDALVSAETSG